MEFTILMNAIGGSADRIENIPMWQKAVPILCFAYTFIALWIGAMKRMLPYNEGPGKAVWTTIIFLIPIIGPLLAIYTFRESKYKNQPTLSEKKEAEEKAEKLAAEKQAIRDQEARDSFKPFED